MHLVHCRVQSKDSLIGTELSKTIGISKQARHLNGWTVWSAIYKPLLLANKIVLWSVLTVIRINAFF